MSGSLTPEQKAAWLAALRSGNYEQGPGQLKRDDGRYCCLGVLCETQGWSTVDPVGRIIAPSYAPIGAAIGYERLAYLSLKNDSGDWPFTRIADYIEENL